MTMLALLQGPFELAPEGEAAPGGTWIIGVRMIIV